MPQNDKSIIFKFGTQAQFNALQSKDTNTIYIITDTHKIYIGDVNYTATVNIENLQDLNLSNTVLMKPTLEQNETYSDLEGYIPKFNSQGQLISSGYHLDQDVLEESQLIDTTYTNATPTSSGLMSAEDKDFIESLKEGQGTQLMTQSEKDTLNNLSNFLTRDDFQILTDEQYNALTTYDKFLYLIPEED